MVSRILLALLFLASTAHAQITLPNDRWQMISPESRERIVLGDMFPALFGDITLTNGRDYAFFAYDPATKAYAKLNADSLLEVGQGLWAIQKTGQEVVSDYVGTPLAGTAQVSLPIGWNMVGVPDTESRLPSYLAIPGVGSACTRRTCSFFQMKVFGYAKGEVYRLGDDGRYAIASDEELEPGEAVWIYSGDEPGLTVVYTGGE